MLRKTELKKKNGRGYTMVEKCMRFPSANWAKSILNTDPGSDSFGGKEFKIKTDPYILSGSIP